MEGAEGARWPRGAAGGILSAEPVHDREEEAPMSGETSAHHDRDQVYRARFDKRLRLHLRTLVTPALIEEHRASPLGQHSDDLERVLNHFRRSSLEGKYMLFELEPNRAYKIVAMTGREGGMPEDVDGRVYSDKNEAVHAIFLRRVDALMGSGS